MEGKNLVTYSNKYKGYIISRVDFEKNFNAVLDYVRDRYKEVNIDTETLKQNNKYIITKKYE